MSEHNIVVQGGTTARLLTAGKYCDRDILVTVEGGGLSLDVVTASALPDTVVDGQIVVITDTTPGTVYIDTDEPASPVAGDLWIEVAAGGDAALVLTEESPVLRNGLVSAYQWDGSAWQLYDGYMGIDGTWVQFAMAIPPVGTALNDMTWKQISIISSLGLAEEYFHVGDQKEIVINGTVGATTFSSVTVNAFIVGIYHNPEYEGGAFVHFQIGKISNILIGLIDSEYGSIKSNTTGYFTPTTSSTSSAGGWTGSHMYKTILGSAYDPSNPLSGSLMAALPSELLAVMKGVTNYTDNTGAASTSASAVTASKDYLWLPAEYEVFGKRTCANTNEAAYQKQYEYYAAGNSPIVKRHSSTSNAAYAWLRSPDATTTNKFCYISYDGTAASKQANYSYAICPCFCV